MLTRWARLRWELWGNQGRERRMARNVAKQARSNLGEAPVIFFNPTTRLSGLSLNAAFSQLVAWSLRSQGVPTIHFVSRSGLQPCVLGTNRDHVTDPPPCALCTAQSKALYADAAVEWFEFYPDPAVQSAIETLPVADLSVFEHCHMPLGALALPSIRWALRRYNLQDDEPTRYLYRQYILSAWNVARHFEELVDRALPRAVVVFNGTFYPEAAARWVALRKGIRVISHETAFLPYSAFFTTGEATAYPIQIPAGYELNESQNQRLDEYLAQRFKGNFTMGGIRFWPEMKGLDPGLEEKIAQFQSVVPVFTNVVFDTSQGHANVVFPDMFAWLDLVLEKIKKHPEILFIIRSHPDEDRPGKSSRETVRGWVEQNRVTELPNVLFIDASEYVSSYELVGRSKFVMAYNSSIGLEAAVLGSLVLCGGKVKYNPPEAPTVYQPENSQSYSDFLDELLGSVTLAAPADFQKNARRFIYFQLFRSSLQFDRFLEPAGYPGFVRLKEFPWQELLPENSPSLRIATQGILGEPSFWADDPLESPQP